METPVKRSTLSLTGLRAAAAWSQGPGTAHPAAPPARPAPGSTDYTTQAPPRLEYLRISEEPSLLARGQAAAGPAGTMTGAGRCVPHPQRAAPRPRASPLQLALPAQQQREGRPRRPGHRRRRDRPSSHPASRRPRKVRPDRQPPAPAAAAAPAQLEPPAAPLVRPRPQCRGVLGRQQLLERLEDGPAAMLR